MEIFLLKLKLRLENFVLKKSSLKVDFCDPPLNTCIVWDGAADINGYSRMVFQNKEYRAHRLAFMVYNKVIDIDTQVEISHLCHVKKCINPLHLALETNLVNLSRRACHQAKTCFKSHTPHCIFLTD